MRGAAHGVKELVQPKIIFTSWKRIQARASATRVPAQVSEKESVDGVSCASLRRSAARFHSFDVQWMSSRNESPVQTHSHVSMHPLSSTGFA
jgi:hypothetical protein